MNETGVAYQCFLLLNYTIMKHLKLFLTVVAAVSAAMMIASSCQKEPESGDITYGTVTGTVTDDLYAPIVDVTVSVNGTELSALTAADGSFTLENVPVQKLTLTFVKEGYATASAPLNQSSFKDGVATINVSMQIGSAVIKGRCLDAKNNNEPLAGVTVKLNGAQSLITGDDGCYEFKELTIDNYELLYQKEGCVDVTKTVTADMFTGDYIVDLGDVRIGGKEILRGATLEDILKFDVWHYNEYRGGKNGDDYPHFDWSSDYMGTFTSWYGWWEEQNEGTTLQIRNREADGDWKNPADLENFDSYLCGIKEITNDNKILNIKMRTHAADAASPAKWGVQVIDLTAAEPEAVLIGGIKEYGDGNYTNPDVSFDLSQYVGKKVAIAIGIFRAETGDYWKQVVLRRLAFAPREFTTADEWSYLPGTAVEGLDAGYKMTQEIVRSTMPVTEFNTFTGISPEPKQQDVDGPEMYREAYKTWRPAGHFAAWWSCMPVQKDSEPFAGEGYVIKTNGGNATVSTTAPQSYFYAKFAISEGHNKLVMKCRTFSGENPTYLKLTAITEDCARVADIAPVVENTTGASEASDGCWKLIHQQGAADDEDGYAKFTYDLSSYNGQNVLVALGVFKGETNGDENKLAIHSIKIE